MIGDENLELFGEGQHPMNPLSSLDMSASSLFYFIDYSNPECAQFETRLTFRERGGAVGNLQICINNTWLAICGNSPSGNVLPVACQALGFNDIPTQLARRIPATIDLVNQSAFGDRLSCAGDEDSLMECQFVEIEGSSEFFCTRPSDIIRIQCPSEYVASIMAHMYVCK